MARELGAEIIDRTLITDIARRASLTPDEVEVEVEHGRSLFDRFSRALVPVGELAPGWTFDEADLVDRHAEIVAFTRAAIREAALSGNVVIVGRGGASELRDRPQARHVFIWAPETDRVAAIRARARCDETAARRQIHAVDSQRAAYVREVYGVDWRDRSSYDLIMNAARLGTAAAAGAILGSV